MLKTTTRVRLAALAATGLLCVFGPHLAAQDEPAAKKSGAPRVNAASRRVPPFYGQIGLTPDQREKIYGIRTEYQTQIVELQRQIDELKAKEAQDCEAVLTEAQRKLLHQRRAAGRSSGKGETKASVEEDAPAAPEAKETGAPKP